MEALGWTALARRPSLRLPLDYRQPRRHFGAFFFMVAFLPGLLAAGFAAEDLVAAAAPFMEALSSRGLPTVGATAALVRFTSTFCLCRYARRSLPFLVVLIVLKITPAT